MKDILIGEYRIGPNHPPFIIAEMSANHNQSLSKALQLVESAAHAGAHAIKLQTYTADTMTLDIEEGDFVIDDTGSLWSGYSLYRLYQEAHTPWEWHEEIMDRCREYGLIFFSTPFDDSAVDFLESLDVPCYKIASFENVDIPLIQKVAGRGKPLIISTGMASVAELSETVQAATDAGCDQLILLKCTSTYPASPDNSNLLTIPHMKDLFDCHVGLSDHTPGIGAALAGIALGAVAVEKHLTLSRADGGVDSAFSLEPDEFRSLVKESEACWRSIGKVSYGPTRDEEGSLKFRRSLYVVKDMKQGEIFSHDNIRSIRPGFGLPPRYLNMVIGKRASRDVKRGTRLTWEMMC